MESSDYDIRGCSTPNPSDQSITHPHKHSSPNSFHASTDVPTQNTIKTGIIGPHAKTFRILSFGLGGKKHSEKKNRLSFLLHWDK